MVNFIIKLLKCRDIVTGAKYNNKLLIIYKPRKWIYFLLYKET